MKKKKTSTILKEVLTKTTKLIRTRVKSEEEDELANLEHRIKNI
jgi:hypothetical protein